jgi:hypothetical protein
VIQRRQGLGFTLESRKAPGIAGKRVGQHLDGDCSRQVRVRRRVHLTQADRADAGADFIRA